MKLNINTSYSVVLVACLALSAGMMAIYRGHENIGLTVTATVLTSFFGYCRKKKEYMGSNPFMITNKESILVLFVLGWAIWGGIANHSLFIPSLTVVLSAVGGYFGISQQELEDE